MNKNYKIDKDIVKKLKNGKWREDHELIHLLNTNKITFSKEFDLNGADLEGIELKDYDLSFISFENANLKNADLSKSQLIGCNFTLCNMENINLNSICCWDARFYDSFLVNSKFRDALAHDCDFFSANLKGSDLYRAKFYGSSFIKANLEDCHISRTEFMECILRGAELPDKIYQLGPIGNYDDGYLVYKIKYDEIQFNGAHYSLSQFVSYIDDKYSKYDDEYHEYICILEVLLKLKEIGEK